MKHGTNVKKREKRMIVNIYCEYIGQI